MKVNNEMDLVRCLSKIWLLARKGGRNLPAAVEETHNRIEDIANDAMTYALRRLVEEAKASTDETIALLRRR